MLADQLEQTSNRSASSSDGSDGSVTTASVFKPESPFLPEPAYHTGRQSSVDLVSRVTADSFILETPFVSEFSLPNATMEASDVALHREIMEEIHDDEFNEALVDLVNELRGVHDERIVGESVGMTGDPAESERFLQSYITPLQQEMEQAIDRMIAESADIDNEALTETRLDAFLDEFRYDTEFANPVFEEFFKKAFRKIRKIAKKGVKFVKKVGKTIAKFTPIGLILGKLKKLVRPLLKRVLKFALNKIPPQFRPLAKKLARRFVKGIAGEVEDEYLMDELLELEDSPSHGDAVAADPDSAAPSPELIALEFDALVAGYVLEGEDFESDPSVEQYFSEEQFDEAGGEADLDAARERFISQITSLDDGEDATPQVEQFVTAVLAGLKLGIKVIGRKRVVNFLAKLVARLIRRFVGKQAARPLSRALVDAGLKLVNLENPQEVDEAAGELLAATVEETVERLLAEAPDEAFEDERLLEVYAQDALEAAAAANFPQSLLRPDIREAGRTNGAWVLRPAGRRKKRYKKYARQFDVTITARMAEQIRSFGNQSLKGFLKEQLGLPIETTPVKATLHLYEAVRGTWLSRISKLETDVPGLGSSRRRAWMQIHPLTCEAASLLIPQDVGLCRNVAPRHLITRDRIAVGQRFYYLEIPGARVVTAPAPREPGRPTRGTAPTAAARASEVNVTLDFQNKRIEIFDFLSEAAANEIAQQMRAGKPLPALITAIRKSLDAAVRSVLSGSPSRHLRIKREVPAEEAFLAALVPVLRFVGKVLARLIVQFIVKQLITSLTARYQAFASEFTAAADQPADGVTITFVASQIDDVMTVLTGSPLARMGALTRLHANGIAGVLAFTIRPGFHRE